MIMAGAGDGGRTERAVAAVRTYLRQAESRDLALAIGGGALIAMSLRKRWYLALPMAIGGGALVFYGAKNLVQQARAHARPDRPMPRPRPAHAQVTDAGADVVDTSSEESFPASDPPSWTPQRT